MTPSAAINPTLVRRLVVAATVATAIIIVYLLAVTINTRLTTGILVVNTADNQTLLSVTGANRDARPLGSGSARVRLKTGSYQLYASKGTDRASAIVTVTKGQTTTTTLKPVNSLFPSVLTINFSGFDSLIDVGVTSGQVDSLKEILFHYKPSSKTISIDSNSLGHGPHDPGSTDPDFTTFFTVSIDGTQYTATIAYALDDSVKLVLQNPASGAVIYDSSVSTQTEGD